MPGLEVLREIHVFRYAQTGVIDVSSDSSGGKIRASGDKRYRQFGFSDDWDFWVHMDLTTERRGSSV